MESGEGMVFSLTNCYRNITYSKPILSLKSFVISPFVDKNAMNYLMSCIKEVVKKVDIKS